MQATGTLAEAVTGKENQTFCPHHQFPGNYNANHLSTKQKKNFAFLSTW